MGISFNKLLIQANLVDVFRKLHLNEKNHYTYWSYRRKAREKNKGWRIDYFLIDKNLFKKVEYCRIHKNQYGSRKRPRKRRKIT